MKISYIASSGNIYDLTARVMTRVANFHSWSFEPYATELMYGERVSSFRKKASVYEATLTVDGSVTHRKALLTALHDDFENDVRNVSTGRIVYGDWYCECYITSSETQPNEDIDSRTENTINIYVPSGFWIREETRTFTTAEPQDADYLDYPFDYEYDYSPPSAVSTLWETDSPFTSDFEMRINGPCVNPRVIINNHPYAVYTSVADGETLVINSRNHTVMNGTENLFDSRNKLHSVFEKIPAGSLSLAWEGFSFTLILFEERSEPKWS